MSFLPEPPLTDEAQALYDGDRSDNGFVMDLTTLWAQFPPAHEQLFALMESVIQAGGFSVRQRGIMVTACASTLGDAYCSLAWGWKLARITSPVLAASVLTGTDEGLSAAEHAMAEWARALTRDPNSTTAADVEGLRAAGWSTRQIFAMTTFAALRGAFSTVNDALGAVPDAELRARVPAEVRDVVTWGR